jgi:hypothetical protein
MRMNSEKSEFSRMWVGDNLADIGRRLFLENTRIDLEPHERQIMALEFRRKID